MQAVDNAEGRIEDALLEIEAIEDALDDGQGALGEDDVRKVLLPLRMALQYPESQEEYASDGKAALRTLLGNVDPDGPYYSYALRARNHLDEF